MPINEADKCTIVSVYPDEIITIKPTLTPSIFVIPKCNDIKNDFELSVIGPASWWKELEENQPFLEIPTGSVIMAASVINDWANGLPDCNMGDRMPGLFFIPGEWDKKSIKAYKTKQGITFEMLLVDARKKQKAWFEEILNTTDVMYARTGGNPRTVGKLSKIAAIELGEEKNKPWMANIVTKSLDNCPSCGEMINLNYPICKHCKAVVNEARAKELGLKFASV